MFVWALGFIGYPLPSPRNITLKNICVLGEVNLTRKCHITDMKVGIDTESI